MVRASMIAIGCFAVSAWAETPSGRWDATATIGKLKIPFTIHFEGEGSAFAGTLVYGDVRIRSTSGRFDGAAARLEFGGSGARLEATLVDSGLRGVFGAARTGMHPLNASPFCTCGFAGEAGPEIMGDWEVPAQMWKLAIRRTGDDTIAVFSRPGGGSGPLAGRFNGAFFELSYFDGVQAALLEIEPRKDGALDLTWIEPGAPAIKAKAARARRGPRSP